MNINRVFCINQSLQWHQQDSYCSYYHLLHQYVYSLCINSDGCAFNESLIQMVNVLQFHC